MITFVKTFLTRLLEITVLAVMAGVAAWCGVYCLDDEARQVREGKKDPRTAVLGSLNSWLMIRTRKDGLPDAALKTWKTTDTKTNNQHHHHVQHQPSTGRGQQAPNVNQPPKAATLSSTLRTLPRTTTNLDWLFTGKPCGQPPMKRQLSASLRHSKR